MCSLTMEMRDGAKRKQLYFFLWFFRKISFYTDLERINGYN